MVCEPQWESRIVNWKWSNDALPVVGLQFFQWRNWRSKERDLSSRDEEIQNESEQLKRVLQDSKTDALYRKRLSQKRPEKRLTSWQRRSMSHNGARSVNGHLFCCRKLFARIIAKQITAITIITAHCPPLAAYTRHKLEDRMWLKSPQCELATWTHKSRTPNLQFGLTTCTYNSHLQIRALTTRALTTPTCERRAVRSKFANLK